jgi:UDP-N-acetylmuramoyl-tripeptide--D-alanyl-D-alanine ligase
MRSCASMMTRSPSPHVGAVTAVGSAHLGAFGSVELTAAAKSELVAALPGCGVAVLNADDPRVAAMATPARLLTVGTRAAVTWRDVSLDGLARPSFQLGYRGAWASVRLKQFGAHHIANACIAAAMALAVDEPLAVIAARLSAAKTRSPMRMALSRRADGLLVVDDSYNANPDSVRAALRTLAWIGARRTGRTVAVLGEMRELGAASEAAHAQIGAFAQAAGVDTVVAVGAPAHPAGGVPVPDTASAIAWLLNRLQPDDTVLVKASRSARLDTVARALLERRVPVQ